MTPRFVPGLELARDFYATVVRPLLDVEFPGLAYAAALIGPGSDVAGYDTERSTDHDWGPRLQVFLTGSASPDEEGASGEGGRLAAGVTDTLAGRLPRSSAATRSGFPLPGSPTASRGTGSRSSPSAPG